MAALNIRIVNASLADIHGAIGAGIGGSLKQRGNDRDHTAVARAKST
jgi:hypothetical protein